MSETIGTRSSGQSAYKASRKVTLDFQRHSLTRRYRSPVRRYLFVRDRYLPNQKTPPFFLWSSSSHSIAIWKILAAYKHCRLCNRGLFVQPRKALHELNSWSSSCQEGAEKAAKTVNDSQTPDPSPQYWTEVQKHTLRSIEERQMPWIHTTVQSAVNPWSAQETELSLLPYPYVTRA